MPGERTGRREWVTRGLLVIGGIVSALLLIEAAVRVFGVAAVPAPRRVVYAGQSHDWCCGPEVMAGRVHQFLPLTSFKHCYTGGDRRDFDADGCVTYRINRSGYRGADFDRAKPADVYRIVTLGDSFTFGEGTDEPSIYPVVLGAALHGTRIDGRRVEVINLGMPDANTAAEGIMYLDVARSLSPDWVILQWGTNDFPTSGVQRDHLRLIGAQYRELFSTAGPYQWSRLLTIVSMRRRAQAISDALVATTRQEAEDGRASFDDIGRIAHLVGVDGARFTVLAFPELIRFDRYPYASILDLLTDYCRSRHIALVNLLPALSRHRDRALWVHVSDHHPNRTAHAIAADALLAHATDTVTR